MEIHRKEDITVYMSGTTTALIHADSTSHDYVTSLVFTMRTIESETTLFNEVNLTLRDVAVNLSHLISLLNSDSTKDVRYMFDITINGYTPPDFTTGIRLTREKVTVFNFAGSIDGKCSWFFEPEAVNKLLMLLDNLQLKLTQDSLMRAINIHE